MNRNANNATSHSFNSSRSSHSTHQRGLSLVESLIALAVTSVVLGSVMPSFSAAVERRHLEGTAAQLATDVHYTRSLAVAQNGGIRMSFRADAGGSCYVVHSGAAADCTCATSGPDVGNSVCRNGATAIKTHHFAATAAVRVQANVGSILFHPTFGTSTPTGTLRVVANKSGQTIHQVVNIMGRVRACTPSGLAGYPAC